MPIPDFQTIMLPLLQIASDGEEHSIHEATEGLARQFSLSEEDDLDELTPEEALEDAYQKIREDLSGEVLLVL